MSRPDDAAFRVRVASCRLLRRLSPVAILVGALVGPLALFDPSVGVWLSAALFCVSLFVLWTLEGLPLYPAYTFGVAYRFEDEPLEGERRRCLRCDVLSEDAVHRRYARQLVVLGVPLYTFEWGSNDFCRDCIDAAAVGVGRASEPLERGAEAGAAETGSEPSWDDSGGENGDGADGTRHRSPIDDPGPDSDPGTDIVRRVDLSDETTALEVAAAFEDDGSGTR